MKKNIILLITFLFAINIFAQSSFTNGFKKGYKKGFCQDQGVGCIDPIPPIAPNPKIGENSDSYTDGYNRGFQMGLSARKNNNSSNNSTDRQRYKTSTSTFKSLSYDELLSIPMALQKRYNQNQEYLYALKRWILELKPQITEQKFINRLNGEYSVLTSMEEDDLARATTALKQRENGIREIISDYNTLIVAKRNASNSNHNSENNDTQRTTMKMDGKLRSSDSPIASVIDFISVGESVRIIEKKGSYWKVFYNGKSGYLNEMYLNVTYPMSTFKSVNKRKKLTSKTSTNSYENTITTTLKMEGELRDNDSPVANVISTIQLGEKVRVIEKKDSYWKVFYKGKTGYLNEMYLNITYKMSLIGN
jgi:hypothetical protein